jgi:hypothetical protein
MTITLKTNERGTRILIEYVVGGYMRYRVEQIAPAVDRMLGQQIARLADKLGGALPGEGAECQAQERAGRLPRRPAQTMADPPSRRLPCAMRRKAFARARWRADHRPAHRHAAGLPAMPRARTTPPVVADDDGLDVSNNTTPPAAPVARPAAPKAAVKPATGKPAANKREPAKPAVKPAPAKPAPGKAKPLPPRRATRPPRRRMRRPRSTQRSARTVIPKSVICNLTIRLRVLVPGGGYGPKRRADRALRRGASGV